MKNSVRILIACVLSFVMVIGSVVPAAAAEQSETVQEVIECADFLDAAAVLREKMEKRQQIVAVTFLSESDDRQVMRELLNEALVHTGVPTQGDYLHWGIQTCSITLDKEEQDGKYKLTLTYTVTYYTTAEQETQVDAAVEQLLDQLDVYNASDYEKISAIYDYICKNVSYDSWGAMLREPLIFTAYAALIRKAAVCQGYATLLYRLALELGVDCRVIPGTGRGGSHGWNIVQLNGKYYNLDATWDAQNLQNGKPYANFLRCEANFEQHIRQESYTTEEFHSKYPMADEDYSEPVPVLAGDLTADGRVDEDDAIYLLQHILMPDTFLLNQTADFTKDGAINEDDAVYLLQYVLMPDVFPL